MNEELVKTIVQYKLNFAEKILEKLTPEVSNNLRNLGKIILESVNESSQNIKDNSECKKKSTDILNNIKIE